jgi:vesicle-associated membrane protein 4
MFVNLSVPRFYLFLLLFTRPEPYDPHLPVRDASTPWNRPGSTSQGPSRSPRVASVQAQIDDTVEVMRENIAKVAERQERLDSLEARTGPCATSSFCY